MEFNPINPTQSVLSKSPIGTLSNEGRERLLLEAESTTGFVAWKLANGTTLISNAMQISLQKSQSVSFWACAGYQDTTPCGRITAFDCHGNSLNHLDVRALSGLEYLDCSYNCLSELALDGLNDLQGLDADNNQLTHLEVRKLSSLRVLYCASNQLTGLDLSSLDLLQILNCSNNPLASLKLEGCTALQDFKSETQPI